MMVRRVCAALLALAACWSSGTHAASPPTQQVLVNGKMETQNILQYAFVQMQFVEISKIDGVEQAFHADFFMVTSWVIDPTGTNFTVNSDLSKEDLEANFWTPSLEFINARDKVTRLVDEPFAFSRNPDFTLNGTLMVPNMTLDRYGRVLQEFTPEPGMLWVQEDQRYQCDFTTPLDMRSFPYDNQFMQLQLESLWDASQVQIVWADPPKIENLIPPTMGEIVGWTRHESVYFPVNIYYQYNDRTYNRLTIRTALERQPAYYLTKIVTGSILLVYMGIWVFSLQIDEADRMMGSLSIFAGLITFLFVAGEDTPKVPYQTRLDVFMMFSFLTVATMVFLHGALYFFRESDVEDSLKEAQAEAEAEGEGDDGSKKAPKGASNRIHDVEMVAAAAAAKPKDELHVDVGAAEQEEKSSTGGGGGSDFASDAKHASVSGGPSAPAREWKLRESLTSDFSVLRWWRGLHLTRKWDALLIPALCVIYGIGVSIIFGRSSEKVALLPY